MALFVTKLLSVEMQKHILGIYRSSTVYMPTSKLSYYNVRA